MNQQHLINPHKYRIPEYFPPELRQELAEVIDLNLWAEIRKAARRPVRVRVSEWALKNREVTEGSNPGPWRHELAPHTVKIMDTFGLPWVQEVWLCKVEQSGGTNSIINCLLQSADCDPGDAFMLMPTEKDSNKIVGRLKNTLKASRNVCDLVSHRADDTTLENIKLLNGMTIFPAHANSPASMSSRPAKYAFGDEVDKYPALAGREADPITLIRKRGRTFRGRVKRFFGSTPAGQFIHKGTYSCHQVWRYDVKCPHCGALIWMDAEHLVIPEGTTPDTADTVEIGYACNTCAAIWTETDRIGAIHSGRWICIKGEDNARPARVGFHHRAWECLDVPLHEIAAAYLRAQAGDLAAKIAWANGYEAVDYEYKAMVGDENEIMSLCDERPAGIVPVDDIATLLLTIDTQKDHFYYVIRAHGYGIDQESWLVSAGMVNSFSALDDMIDNHAYFDAGGNEYRIEAAAIDTGGTKHDHQEHSRTIQVYNWVRSRRKVFAFKGSRSGAKPYSMTRLDHYPNGKNMRGGLRLWNVNANLYKGELDRRLQINIDDPGAFHLHSGFTSRQLQAIAAGDKTIPNGLAEYARHMVAEAIDDHGQYQPIKGRRHDYRDCENYQIILADILRIKHRRKISVDEKTRPARRTSSKRKKNDD